MATGIEWAVAPSLLRALPTSPEIFVSQLSLLDHATMQHDHVMMQVGHVTAQLDQVTAQPTDRLDSPLKERFGRTKPNNLQACDIIEPCASRSPTNGKLAIRWRTMPVKKRSGTDRT
jgi:hypothetical protein